MTSDALDDPPPAQQPGRKHTARQLAALTLRSERAKTKRAHARGLRALDQLAIHLDHFHRWKVIAAVAPSAILRKDAETARDTHSRRAADYLTVVQRALGQTEDDDTPATHWDRGAMED
jgi:hypothetical protein